MPVDTAKVGGRRSLHFDGMDQIVDEAARLAAGPCRQLGNWSLGQICDHLARTIDGSVDGMKFSAPWYVRLLARLMKRSWLNRAMPAGFKLPADAAKQLIAGEGLADAHGVEKLRQAVARFQRESRTTPSPVFGPMTHDDWVKLHCRHSELHLSFLQPGA